MVKKILIVDDDINLRESLKRSLRELKIDIICAASAKDALELINLNDIDLIISDYNMPGMSGYNFIKKINLEHPEIATFMLTGKADFKESITLVNGLNLNKFFTKPFDKKDLLESIKCL